MVQADDKQPLICTIRDSIVRCCLRSIALCVLAFPPHAIADAPDLQDSQYIYRQWGTKEGLAGQFVWRVLKGSQGYLWLATENGLSRFDGVSFTNFDSTTHDAFRVNDLRDLSQAADDSLWIATYGGGVLRYHDGRFSRFGVGAGLNSEVVYSVVAARDGVVWAGTDQGVCRWSGGESFQCFDEADGVANSRYYRLVESDQGEIYAATLGNGALRFDEQGVWPIREGLLDDKSIVSGLSNVPGLGVTLAVNRSKAFTFDGDSVVPFELPNAAGNGTVYHVAPGIDDSLWLALERGGILKMVDGKASASIPAFDELNVLHFVVDADDAVWLATDGGLHYRGTGSVTAFAGDNLLSPRSFVLAADTAGGLWVGAENDGLAYKGADGRITFWTSEDGLPGNTVSSLAITPNGGVWVGTFGAGVVLFERNQFGTPITVEEGLADNVILSLHVDSRSHLWVGTGAGLHRVEDGVVVDRLSTQQGLPSDIVRHINEDSEGRLWLSTQGGVAVYNIADDTIEEVYTDADGLSNSITGTTALTGDSVWVGSMNGGLARIRNGEIFAFGPQHGIRKMSMPALYVDRKNHLWMAGRDGISRASITSLDAVAEGKTSYVDVFRFDETDGFLTARVFGGTQAPVSGDSDGNVWFATAQGPALVDLDAIPSTELRGAPRVAALRASDVFFELNGKARLPKGTRALQIDYGFPDLRLGGKLRYRYRMVSSDPGWELVGNRQTAFFTNPDSGLNEFEVQVTRDGVLFAEDGGNTARLSFYIIPHWYELRWVQVLGALLAVLLLVIRMNQARNNLRRRLSHLRRIVDEKENSMNQAMSLLSDAQTRDSISLLKNRTAFVSALHSLSADLDSEGSQLGLILVDIDDYRDYNDFAGQEAADECLRQIGAALVDAVSDSNLVFRTGSAEFAVLVRIATNSELVTLAHSLKSAVDRLQLKHPGRPQPAFISVSQGYAWVDRSRAVDSEAVIRLAGRALKKAMDQGRGAIGAAG